MKFLIKIIKFFFDLGTNFPRFFNRRNKIQLTLNTRAFMVLLPKIKKLISPPMFIRFSPQINW